MRPRKGNYYGISSKEVTFVKEKIIEAIDSMRDEIIEIGDYVLKNPEMGYKEYKTAELVKNVFDKLGIEYRDKLALTGVKGEICGNGEGPNICIIGEMDAVKCFGHPYADSDTGAAHACGHNAQIASLLGAAIGIVKSKVMEKLSGKVTFFAVPAEEFVELEWREQLKNDGKIEFFGGKQELIRLGEFDGIDMAMMVHSQAGVQGPEIYMDGSSLGFNTKQISFKGKAVHASEPFEGVNALNAAMLALMGIHANRETFRDEDKVRIHPIITNGGELVNVVPSMTTIETYVRGANQNAIENACEKVDNAVKAGAMAVGAECEIKTTKGYMPLNQDKELGRIFEENAKVIAKSKIHHGIDMTGSTDMGDLSAKIPCIQPTMGGFSGSAHGKDFSVCDKEAAYIMPAKIMACTVYDLLSNKFE